jgi:hypothetical protein
MVLPKLDICPSRGHGCRLSTLSRAQSAPLCPSQPQKSGVREPVGPLRFGTHRIVKHVADRPAEFVAAWNRLSTANRPNDVSLDWRSPWKAQPTCNHRIQRALISESINSHRFSHQISSKYASHYTCDPSRNLTTLFLPHFPARKAGILHHARPPRPPAVPLSP